jgi:uncharacterized protein (TIGR03382 family)
MTTIEAHRTVAAVAVVSAAGVWLLNGRAEGVGAVTSAAVMVAWVTSVLFRRRRGAQTRGSDEAALTDDQCITVIGWGTATYLALQYLARSDQAAEGAIGVNVFVALYLVWAYFGTRWLARRRAARASARH